MKKLLKTALITAAALLMAFGCAFPAYAAAYSTYTYSIDGEPLLSPDAYTPVMQVDSKYMGLDVAISDPRDLVVDKSNNVYIADAANNRIVALDPYYRLRFTFGENFLNSHGVYDSLNTPSGLFVTKDKIYVADTENNRIVIFDLEGNYIKHLEEPESNIFEDNAIYKPVALAVDASERIYVVSSTTYQGILSLNSNGEFQSYVGAQKVAYSAIDIFWRQFQTAEQRALSTQYIPTEYNNITIDDRGFIYVTTSSIDEANQQDSIKNNSADYAPVKMFNASGDDILGRNGFFGPGGEVKVNNDSLVSSIKGASKIIDVALGPEGTWSIIDEKRNKIYTYDSFGNLLFAFGDTGNMMGCLQSIEAIVYQDETMLVLDKTANNITVYTRTEYGDILLGALKNDNDRKYDEAINDWFKILQRNSNFDAAYVGIGKAYYRNGEWTQAMEYFKNAYDIKNYSMAFGMYRTNWASRYFLIVPIAVIVLIWLLVLFSGYAKKVNKKGELYKGKRTFWQEFMYVFHIMLHPFDGFWDLKHEKRGSVRAGLFIILLSAVAFSYQAIGRSYIFNPRATYSSVFMQALSLIVPIILWVTANWCLTTLFEGEGSFKDVFIATAYSLMPLPLFIIPSTIITHILTQSETTVYTTLNSIGWVWVGLLLFFGMMVTHDYTLFKNVITCVGTIVGMAVIMFLGLLFSNIVTKMVGFVSSIATELSYRM
ncbi:MAG: YIP1 family protein [Firmicutes bacterium]|nr:YIP1 family protein [Bacillota bacterium]